MLGLYATFLARLSVEATTVDLTETVKPSSRMAAASLRPCCVARAAAEFSLGPGMVWVRSST